MLDHNGSLAIHRVAGVFPCFDFVECSFPAIIAQGLEIFVHNIGRLAYRKNKKAQGEKLLSKIYQVIEHSEVPIAHTITAFTINWRNLANSFLVGQIVLRRFLNWSSMKRVQAKSIEFCSAGLVLYAAATSAFSLTNWLFGTPWWSTVDNG